MTTFRRFLLAAVLAVSLMGMGLQPLHAQTTLNSTTLSAAVTASTQTIALTSLSNVAVNDLLIVDREAMRVTAVGSTSVQVARGVHGAARAHASLARVWTGAPGRFYPNHVIGPCTATAEQYLPHIALNASYDNPSLSVYQCVGGYWQLQGDDTNVVTVACWTGALFTSSIDRSCWTADRDYVIVRITESHTVAESGGTLTLIPRKQVGTQAAASGTALGTAVSMVSTAETVNTFTLSATAGALNVGVGNRLGLDFTDDVAGELAGVLVTFYLLPR